MNKACLVALSPLLAALLLSGCRKEGTSPQPTGLSFTPEQLAIIQNGCAFANGMVTNTETNNGRPTILRCRAVGNYGKFTKLELMEVQSACIQGGGAIRDVESSSYQPLAVRCQIVP